MTALEAAARANDWERLALCLLAGLLSAIEKMPSDSLSELLDILSAEDVDGGSREG